MRFRVCSDVGGTFSDLFVFDENNGEWNIFKAFTVPRRPSDGIMAGLRQAALGMRFDGPVICLMTSTGFKDQGLPAPELPPVSPTWEAVRQTLKSVYNLTV